MRANSRRPRLPNHVDRIAPLFTLRQGMTMKYKDYYQALGVERTASDEDIRKAYRKLAHRYHPDVSRDPKGEEKFKEIAEAYATLKDPEKRREYDRLGRHSAGEEFSAPPEWQQHYGAGATAFDDVDLADILNAFRHGAGRGQAGRRRGGFAAPGEDYEVHVDVPLETLFSGGETDVSLELPEQDAHGLPHRVQRTFRVNIPKGATAGQRLRLAGKGEPGRNGGKPGDLYIALGIAPHPLYRVNGRDLTLDLALAPWEAALGATVEIPTPGGAVELNIKPGTSSGQRLRLAKRGLPAPHGSAGDLYAVVQIMVPAHLSKAERELYEQLKSVSHFNPRKHFGKEST
ncbi:MAG: molecular chaperone DnaJ [Paucimonas sp.]|nr:molecular chaperone DnaJ [Paucimonas sp.]